MLIDANTTWGLEKSKLQEAINKLEPEVKASKGKDEVIKKCESSNAELKKKLKKLQKLLKQ